MSHRFFDSASTTPCCKAAAQLIQRFAVEDFGNPSSSHAFGQQAARAIRESRLFLSESFRVNPEQVIFTGSGSEADNLAIYGIALHALAQKKSDVPFRVLASATDHPAVRKTAQSLLSLGIEVCFIPVDSQGQVRIPEFRELLTPNTLLVSIQQVNNITGAILPVEDLARIAKERVPNLIFHTDAVQAFGKIPTPTHPSTVDLASISGHKIKGPKGVGALIVLDKKLLRAGLRPLIWGGEQEGGMRSGTQNAGLIAGFHAAAHESLSKREENFRHVEGLKSHFRNLLQSKGLLSAGPQGNARDSQHRPLHWNSPERGSPYVASLSIPGFPSGPFAKLLEERGFLISTGSACSSHKAEPDAVLAAMGFGPTICNSALRVSFSDLNTLEDVTALVEAMAESIQLMSSLLGGKPSLSSSHSNNQISGGANAR